MRYLRTVRAGSTVLVLALAVTACGSSRSTPASSGSSNATPAASSSMFGDLASPCGHGSAKGATDQGITDTAITIGYGDDRGFASAPGLDKEMGDAVKAMIGWCNDQGGINGRQVVGNQYDAAYLNAASVMQKSCKQDFMMVGQGFAYDEAAEPFRVGCGLATVPGFVIGPNASMGPNMFQPVPLPVDYYNGANLAAAMSVYPEFKQNVTTLGSTSAPIQQGVSTVISALGKLGANVKDCGVSLSQTGEANYVPFAEKFKTCGASSLWVTNSPTPIAFGLLEAMQRVKTNMKYVFESTWYGDIAKQWNAKSHAADGMVTGMVFQPFENADTVPAVKDYLDVIKAGGAKQGLLGMQSTSAFLLWAQAAKSCGSDLTRACMEKALAEVHEWTGGGLHAPSDPGSNMPSDCALVVQLKGGTFAQVHPAAKGKFDCNKDYVVATDAAKAGVKLDGQRIATAFQKK